MISIFAQLEQAWNFVIALDFTFFLSRHLLDGTFSSRPRLVAVVRAQKIQGTSIIVLVTPRRPCSPLRSISHFTYEETQGCISNTNPAFISIQGVNTYGGWTTPDDSRAHAQGDLRDLAPWVKKANCGSIIIPSKGSLVERSLTMFLLLRT